MSQANKSLFCLQWDLSFCHEQQNEFRIKGDIIVNGTIHFVSEATQFALLFFIKHFLSSAVLEHREKI